MLFASDLENRSAVYHAARAGHKAVVKAYLALLVLSRFTKDLKASLFQTATLSFESWFHHFGRPFFFGRAHFEICVLRSTKKMTSVFVSENMTIGEIIAIAKDAARFSCVIASVMTHFVNRYLVAQTVQESNEQNFEGSCVSDDLESVDVGFPSDTNHYISGEADDYVENNGAESEMSFVEVDHDFFDWEIMSDEISACSQAFEEGTRP